MDTMEPLPSLLEPDWETAETILYQGRGRIIEMDVPCEVTVDLQWLPRHEVRLLLSSTVDTPVNWLHLNKHKPFHVHLDNLAGPNNLVEAYHRKSSWDKATAWLAERTLTGDAAAPVKLVSGSLVNFIEANGSPLKGAIEGVEWDWLGRNRWVVEGWEIILDAHPGAGSTLRRIRDNGGYSRTHALRISKVDGAQFMAVDAEAAMEAIHLALSFLAGRFTAPQFEGIRANGERAWQEWATPKVDQLTHGHQELWSGHRGQSIELMAAPLIKAFLNAARRPTLAFLIQAHLGANGSALLEQRLLLAFAAIEHLAWIRLVHEQGKNPQKIDSKGAEWRIRRMLTDFQIPTTPPAHLPTLKAYAATTNMDSAKAVTELRHALTHPKDPHALYAQAGLLREAWLLTSHWLSLLILAWVDYRGEVIDTSDLNRWGSDTITTPW
ncbi:hypothetical protein [Nonomuraea sp. NPDC049750]|uniref:hypothetical protein n=2 Tax=unclassified Nonomuraea TaxID=2593643 RepID=UPI0033EA0B9C